MKLDKIKKIPSAVKQLLKPDWKRVALLVILFMVLPQNISGSYVLFGGVYFVKSLFDFYQPMIDLSFTLMLIISSYIVISLAVWLYEKKINTFIVTEGEEDVQPPEQETKQEAKVEEKAQPVEEKKEA
jgi:hypothetical protein